MLSYIAVGCAVAPTTLPTDADESQKLLTAKLASGESFILLDNMDERRVIRNATPASILTASSWSARRLGETAIVSTPAIAVWMMTGNNP